MFNVTKFPAISVLTGMLLSVSGAFASAPLFIPLGTMIAEAEAVAVVRIEKIDEILRPRDMPKVWYPNRTVTIRTTEIVRGKLPESFTVRVLIDTHSNPSAKVGEAALIFLSDTKPGKDGDLPAYEAAQGFRVVSDLVAKGDEKAQAAVRDALAAAVKASPPKSQRGRMWDPELTEAATEPILTLLKSNDPLVRRWALSRGLNSVHVTPDLGKRLVGLLADKDDEVARSAAHILIDKKQRSAEAALREYQKRIPASKAFEYTANEVRGTLKCWKVMKRVDALPVALAKQVAAEVTDRHTRSEPVSLDLRLDTAAVRLENAYGKGFSDALLRDLREQFTELPAELEKLPFRVTLYVYRDNGVVTWDGQWSR